MAPWSEHPPIPNGDGNELGAVDGHNKVAMSEHPPIPNGDGNWPGSLRRQPLAVNSQNTPQSPTGMETLPGARAGDQRVRSEHPPIPNGDGNT